MIVRTPAISEPYHAMLLANQERLARWEAWAVEPMTLDGTRSYLGNAAREWVEGRQVPTAILARTDGGGWELAGAAALRIDSYDRVARLGYWIDAGHEGRGLVTRAGHALIGYAFDTLGLARIELGTVLENARSRAVADRLGFVHEGTLRSATAHPGGRRDAVIYGLLASDWAATGGPA